MAIRFRKSVNLGSGVKLNIGKSSVGLSGGVKGARVSLNSRGQLTRSASLPGTGVSYRTTTKLSGQHTPADELPEGDGAQQLIVYVPNALYRICAVLAWLAAAVAAVSVFGAFSAGSPLFGLLFLALAALLVYAGLLCWRGKPTLVTVDEETGEVSP